MLVTVSVVCSDVLVTVSVVCSESVGDSQCSCVLRVLVTVSVAVF